jgi:hypothetical protein
VWEDRKGYQPRENHLKQVQLPKVLVHALGVLMEIHGLSKKQATVLSAGLKYPTK